MAHSGCVRSLYSWIVLLISVALTAGCGSSSTTVLSPSGPSGQRCAVAFKISTSSITSTGGSGTISVTTARECEWTARAESDWLTFSAPATGQGPADLAFSVRPNPSTLPRSVVVSVGDQRATISQEGATCPWNVSPSEVVVGPAAEDRTIRLSTEDSCSWVVRSRESWVRVVSGTTGTGNASIVLRVARNDGPERTAIVEVPGGTVNVRQREGTPPSTPTPPEPPPPQPIPPEPSPGLCTFQVAPARFNDVLFSGTSLQVDVTTQAGCAWSAASQATWVTISSGLNGTGSGRVQLSVDANTGSARSGTLLVAGESVTVNQQSRPACSFTISPGSYNPSSTGGTVSVTVATLAGCAWTVSGTPAWVSATPNSQTGAGTVVVTVQPNLGAVRSTTFKIAGRDFVVQQASAPCTYLTGATSQSVSDRKSTLKIAVTTQSHCPVSVTENASWLAIASAPSSGSGEIAIRIDDNTKGEPRSATVTMTGANFSRVFTIIQEGRN